VAAVAPEQAQQLQSMARDLAAMGQQISDLKATIEQLKTSQAQMAQAQMTSAPAKTTEARLTEPAPRLAEPAPRPRIAPPPAPPVHAATTGLRRPKQVFPYAPIAPASPPQAAPAQVQAAEDGGPVVRPPMPLH
jgi:TolA-binding protein